MELISDCNSVVTAKKNAGLKIRPPVNH